MKARLNTASRRSLYPSGSSTARALELFQISGQRVPDLLIRAYLQLKQACAHANWECGALSTARRNAIVKATRLLLDEPASWTYYFPIDRFQAGAGTTLNMNINEAISLVAHRRLKVTSLHPNDAVNRSQSTNDTYPTALRVALLGLAPMLSAAIKGMQRAFAKKSDDWAEIPKAGRTHLQDAAPMMLGDQMGSYSRTLDKLQRVLDISTEPLLEMPLGGTAVGNGINTPSGYRTAALKHLRRIASMPGLRAPKNPFEVQSSALDLLGFANALAAIAVELQRIASDLRLQSSGPFTGIQELELPPLLAGSSIMPGKVNPSALEMLHQVTLSTLGCHAMTLGAAGMGQFELNVMTPAIAPELLQSTSQLTAAIELVTRRVIDPMKPNVATLERHWRSTEQWAVLLAPEWGYERVAEWVRQSRESGLPFLEWIERNQGLRITPPESVDRTKAPSSMANGRARKTRN